MKRLTTDIIKHNKKSLLRPVTHEVLQSLLSWKPQTSVLISTLQPRVWQEQKKSDRKIPHFYWDLSFWKIRYWVTIAVDWKHTISNCDKPQLWKEYKVSFYISLFPLKVSSVFVIFTDRLNEFRIRFWE